MSDQTTGQAIVTELRAMRHVLNEIRALLADAKPASTLTASDAELDGPHGDPSIRAKDPRDWPGESMLGRKFSQCPPEYLDMLAQRYDYFASKEDDDKKRRYNELDAKRARGWAARLRAGYVPTAPAAPQGWAEPTADEVF